MNELNAEIKAGSTIKTAVSNCGKYIYRKQYILSDSPIKYTVRENDSELVLVIFKQKNSCVFLPVIRIFLIMPKSDHSLKWNSSGNSQNCTNHTTINFLLSSSTCSHFSYGYNFFQSFLFSLTDTCLYIFMGYMSHFVTCIEFIMIKSGYLVSITSSIYHFHVLGTFQVLSSTILKYTTQCC